MAVTTGAQGKPKLFYGWVIVGVMAVTGALTMALGTLNFGLFIRPMGDELGIGRALFGWTQTARQAASAVTSPLMGHLIDRFGSRVLLAVAAAVTGLALAGMAFMTQAWHLVALFAVMGLLGLGGPGSLVTSVPVAKWFVRHRGRAMSFMSLGIPLGGVVFVPLTQVFIDGFGWRNAWIVLAGVGAGLIIPLSLVFVRRQPEDMGLFPDGDAPASRPSPEGSRQAPFATPGAVASGSDGRVRAVPRHVAEPSWTVREALRTPAFWSLVAVFSLVMLGMSSVGLHRIPQFVDRGIDPKLVSYATALDAVAAGASTFAMGLVVDRVHVRFVGAGGLLLLGLATFFTIVADTPGLMFLAMLTFGTGVGALMLLRNILFADYFGRRHLGSIQGVVAPVTLISGGAGAPLAGYIHDATGSYNSIWWGSLGLMVVGAVLLALTAPPAKKMSPRPSAATPASSLPEQRR